MIESTKDTGPQSRALLNLDLRHGATWEPSTGLLVALSGQRFTWSRGTTLASVPVPGGSYTAPATLPGWALADSGLGLHLDTSDVLREAEPTAWAPTDIAGRFRFVERGSRLVSGATLWAITPDDPTSGVRLYLAATAGGYYELVAHNGTTGDSATLTAGQPLAGDLVEIRWTWEGGRLQLRQYINHAAPTMASVALALPTAWSAGTRIRIGRRGATANPAALTLLSHAIVSGWLDDRVLDEVF